MNKRRLLKLADLLEADAKNKKGIKFDLGVVGQPSNYFSDEKFEPGLNCGTTACAMGLAAISGKFKRAGLSYLVRNSDIHTTVNGRRRDYDCAAMKVFDITQNEAHFLFTPSAYRDESNFWADHPREAKGEREVAKRIRAWVAGKVQAPTWDC